MKIVDIREIPTNDVCNIVFDIEITDKKILATNRHLMLREIVHEFPISYAKELNGKHSPEMRAKLLYLFIDSIVVPKIGTTRHIIRDMKHNLLVVAYQDTNILAYADTREVETIHLSPDASDLYDARYTTRDGEVSKHIRVRDFERLGKVCSQRLVVYTDGEFRVVEPSGYNRENLPEKLGRFLATIKFKGE